MVPMPASTTELAHLLRSADQRATPQRLMILSVLQEADRHLTADEVFQQLGPMRSALNRSTVYRTLERFRDAGLVSETDLGGGVRVFVWIYILMIFGYVLMSWVRLPYSRTAATVQQFLDEVCRPYLRLFRRLPTLGPLDVSPIIAVVVLLLVSEVVIYLIGALL